jgi:2'-5'-oligoadenylate synthetase 1, domain 2, C-terminus
MFDLSLKLKLLMPCWWCQANFDGLPKIPNSYALELITIRVWECAGQPQSFQMDRMFKSVMERLAKYSSFKIYWTACYSDTVVTACNFAGRYVQPYNIIDYIVRVSIISVAINSAGQNSKGNAKRGIAKQTGYARRYQAARITRCEAVI